MYRGSCSLFRAVVLIKLGRAAHQKHAMLPSELEVMRTCRVVKRLLRALPRDLGVLVGKACGELGPPASPCLQTALEQFRKQGAWRGYVEGTVPCPGHSWTLRQLCPELGLQVCYVSTVQMLVD